MKQIIRASVAFAIILSACNNTMSSSGPNVLSSKSEKKDKTDDSTAHLKIDNSENKVLNDISVETRGSVKMDRVFLSFENGDVVPSSNITSLGNPIYLNLNIATGWKEDEGAVSLGAFERISSDKGTVFLDEPDLFQNYNSINAEDAKFIRIKALVSNKKGAIRYFIVDYKVWDKKGDGVITGSYRFYVQ